MTAKEEFDERTRENQKHRGTYRPHGAVARREPGLVAAWRIGEAQARRARPLQDRPCQRFQGRRRSRDESGRHLTAATRLFRNAMADATALGANARALAGVQKIAALDPRSNYHRPAGETLTY